MALKMLMLFVGLIILGLSTGTKMRPRVNHSRKGLSGGCKPKDIKQGAFHPYSCLDYLKKGFTKCGIYKLVDSNDNSFPAYCDLQSEPGSAWTLVMSWSHSYHRLPTFISTGFKTNGPVNENSHNWNMYRLSLPRIRSLQTHSTHWRATCSYPNHDIDYRDYLRGNFKDFNIVDYLGSGQCRKVEYINIRGHIGIHLTARFWQSTSGFLHIDSSHTGCQFNPTSGSVSSEDNFGGHSASNPNFRCTKDGQSTTQWWFGGHL